jgi:hypothetical protein
LTDSGRPPKNGQDSLSAQASARTTIAEWRGGFGESLKNGVRISFGPLVKDTAKIDEGLARLGTWMRGTQAP